MRRVSISLTLICMLLLNGAAIFAVSKNPQRKKSRVERSNTSARTKAAREKRESRKEAIARREAIKRNPRAAALFKGGSDLDGERFDQPREALEAYVQKRLPRGEKQLPIERYFTAKEKIKQMNRFSSAKGKNLPPQANSNDAEILDPGDFSLHLQQLAALQKLRVFLQRRVHGRFLGRKVAHAKDLLQQAVIQLDMRFHETGMYTILGFQCT